eukprot:160909_1
MFAEVEVAENLLKNKERISQSASVDDLNKLWVNFNEGSSQFNKAAKQMRNCTDKGSLFVCRKTPSIHMFYKLGKLLGSPGQYGICKEAVCIEKGNPNYKKRFAVKIINKRKYSNQSLTHSLFNELRAETQLLSLAHEHPNIITYHQVFEDVQHLYIVMNYCGGGELFERISRDQKFSEQKASNLFRQMMSCLYYIHQLGIAHCDLKPENFIFETDKEDSAILLIDFGMAKIVQWRKYHKVINGTPYYIAPEVLSGKYNELCDMWSMGVILFVMVFGYPPFHSADATLSPKQSDAVIFKQIKQGFKAKVLSGFGPWFPQSIPVSKGCKDLISRLLRIKVADRLTSEEALEHQWLKQSIDTNPIKKVMNSSILNSLRGFNSGMNDAKSGLQAQILGLLHKCNYLNNNQTKSVQEFFEVADKNGDGRITEKELYDALKQVDPDITNEDVRSILTAIDADNDGFMDCDELLSSRIARKLQSNEDRLRKVFCLLDFDKSGKISPTELKQALDAIELDQKLSAAKCHDLIKECDADGDGEIDFEEFIQLFRKL